MPAEKYFTFPLLIIGTTTSIILGMIFMLAFIHVEIDQRYRAHHHCPAGFELVYLEDPRYHDSRIQSYQCVQFTDPISQ